MVDIDEEKLQNLMELVIKEHPDLDPYVVWIISANFWEQRNKESGYNIRVV